MFVVEPAPPPIKIPTLKSPDVPFADTPLIMLLAIKLVPEVAGATKIPQAEKVPVLRTEPIIFFVTVALVTSLPVKVLVEIPVVPSEIPNTSGKLVCAIPPTLLAEMVMLFSNPTRIPIVATLLGETVLTRF